MMFPIKFRKYFCSLWKH